MSTNAPGDVRSAPPAPGASPSGASEGLFGVLESYVRLPSFGSMLERVFGLVRQNPGDIKLSSALTAPDGWLLCDGKTYDIAAYPRLFRAIGTTWGGDGVSTFAVPDLAARMPIASGTSGSGAGGRGLGDKGGATTQTLITANLPAHTHGINDPGHNHAGPGTQLLVGGGIGNANLTLGGGGYNNGSNLTQSSTTGITTLSAGSGSSFPIMPPYAAVHFYVYAG